MLVMTEPSHSYSIFTGGHAHTQQRSLLTEWHDDYLLFIKWRWIITEDHLHVEQAEEKEGKRMGWSCCPRGGRSGVGQGGREAGTLDVPLWKYIIISVWLFCLLISLRMCVEGPSPPSTVCFSFSPCIIREPCWKRSLKAVLNKQGLPGSSSIKESACQCRRCERLRFDPWAGKITWRRAWRHTPVLSPGESHGQRSLAGCSPWGHRESDTTERLLL